MIVDVQNKLICEKGGLTDIGIPFPLDDVGKDFFNSRRFNNRAGISACVKAMRSLWRLIF
jgi:hypothetical protein